MKKMKYKKLNKNCATLNGKPKNGTHLMRIRSGVHLNKEVSDPKKEINFIGANNSVGIWLWLSESPSRNGSIF